MMESGTIGELQERKAKYFGWSAMAVAVVPLLVSLLSRWFGYVPAGDQHAWKVWLGLLMIFGPPILSGIGSSFANKIGDVTAGGVWVEGDEIVVARAGAPDERIPRTEVLAGYLNTANGGRLELSLRDGRVLVASATNDSEKQHWLNFLQAAKLDAKHRRLELRSGGRATPWFVGANLVLVFNLLITALAGIEYPDRHGNYLYNIAALIVSAALALAIPLSSRRNAITIGTDGVLLGSLWKARFVSFQEVSEVQEVSSRGVPALLLRSGEFVVLGDRTDPNMSAILTRIREAMSARAETPDATIGAALERGEQSIASWREALAALVKSKESYRSASFTPERLREVLEDSEASPSRRIAAALMLVMQPSSNAQREHIRVIADTCADEQVRVALVHIAEDNVSESVLEAATSERNAKK